MSNNNYIIAEFYIKDINTNTRIINSFEQFENEDKIKDEKIINNYRNEKELKENCEIEINNELIKFSYFHKFNKSGRNIIKYKFKNNLTKTVCLFTFCESLKNIELSILILKMLII